MPGGDRLVGERDRLFVQTLIAGVGGLVVQGQGRQMAIAAALRGERVGLAEIDVGLGETPFV